MKAFYLSILLICSLFSAASGRSLVNVLTNRTSIDEVRQVSGTVKDSSGMAMPGVSVRVKGAKMTTLTNSEGKYSISANPQSVLVFTMIGFGQKEVKVGTQTIIDVVLSDNIAKLNEVVITAIGIKQQKRKLGYATQEVKTEVLAEAKTMNLGNALSGQVAGLTVNNPTGLFQAPSFSLRGRSPIIVVDGIPVETDFYDIPSSDIENINVLKGTTAAALYGTRGKDGAVLITTKKANKDGLEITVGTNNMVTAGFTVYPETQTEYGNGSNGKYEFWDGADGGVSDGDMIWGPKFGTGIKVAQWNSPIRDKQTGEVIPWWGDVKGTKYDDKARYERVPIDWVRHDNLKDFLGTGIVTNNNFSVGYKGAKGQFYFSAKQAYQKGQVPNTSLSTGGLSFNSSYNIAKNLQLDASLSYNKVYSPNYPRYGYGPKNHMYTILIWMGDDVNGKDLKEHMYVPGFEGFRQANYNYAWYNNPYFASYELEQKLDRNVATGQLKLSWQVLPDLTLQGRVNLRENKSFSDMKSPKSYMNYGDSRNGDYKLWDDSQQNLDADFLANYSKNLTSDVALTVNAGASVFNRQYRQEYQSTDGLIVPFVYSLNNTQGRVQATNEFNEKAIRSVYASVNVDLFKALYLNATGRNDWSSTLPTKNNSYFYPSVSASTIVSEYVKMPGMIDYLKLNASWAQVSSDLDPYKISPTYRKGTTYESTPSVYYPGNLVNPDIKPETSSSFETGLSFSLFRNLLSFDATYYRILDEDQIIDLTISEASGFATRTVNGNNYITNGLEIIAGARPFKGRNFSWDIGVNWSRSVKKITEIYGGQQKFNNLSLNDRADSYYATVWQKSAAGELILDANTGLPTKDRDLAKLGHLDPDWRLGVQNKFKIKGFTVNADVDGAWGGLLRSVTIEKMWWGGKHPASVEYRDAEYEAGKPVYVPQGVIVTGGQLERDVNGKITSDTRTYAPNTRAVSWQTWGQIYPYQAQVTESENKKFANVFDRTYFKLRRLSVSYDLAKIMNTVKVKNLDLSLYGYNLYVWKKIPYVDPDYGNDNDLQDPSARYLGVSLNVKF
ncbi:SusC/RagA family TonB-linked outer membrane protein [Arcticibacter tournemirensis]|uniref:SusC/RagA family TonB-linked outer membrane protein n=1 Tax=Arcticibacter tournemirensis TaxID=699437 RepID=A0A4V1KHP1_9SPHI|nr:SusC/RagA family TonB-linked outer membrane protein [Arcticibacter tournemirensis]RXF67872.1 SusC/RagA family TonB-linked outer membrane protein [Arcticibacter tournemirensis]